MRRGGWRHWYDQLAIMFAPCSELPDNSSADWWGWQSRLPLQRQRLPRWGKNRPLPKMPLQYWAFRKTFDQTLLLPPLTSKLLIVYVNYIKLYNAYSYDSNAVFSLLWTRTKHSYRIHLHMVLMGTPRVVLLKLTGSLSNPAPLRFIWPFIIQSHPCLGTKA